jgi:hypothetical protein
MARSSRYVEPAPLESVLDGQEYFPAVGGDLSELGIPRPRVLDRFEDMPALQEVRDPNLEEFGQVSQYRSFSVKKASQPAPTNMELVQQATMDTEFERSHRRSPLRAGSQGDYRPNRTLKGSSRTSLVMRKQGFFNETRYRDHLINERISDRKSKHRSSQHSTRAIHLAVERIQRIWRRYRRYCLAHEDYFKLCNAAITKIQRRWRFYHAQRVKYDRSAMEIQRFVRGMLVRGVLSRNNAAVTIQRHIAGFLCRKLLAQLNTAAVEIQRVVRGGLGRGYCRIVRNHRSAAAITIQAGFRARVERLARHEALAKRVQQERRELLAVLCQRYCRGIIGRKRHLRFKHEFLDEVNMAVAATKIQACVRRDLGMRKVSAVRRARRQEHHAAATHIRKAWLGFRVRRYYQEMREKFLDNMVHVIVMQRYTRGFLVRNRIWRSAAQAESELWASVELQRMWRGYRGRLRWEQHYELYWSRQIAAVRVQSVARCWLAKLRVHRIRQSRMHKRLAAERRLFTAAQTIQKHARGLITRTHVFALLRYLYGAAIYIQKIWRGYVIRNSISSLVRHRMACRAQAHIRGFLVRARFRYLTSRMILLQRCWRTFFARPVEQRASARRLRKERVEAVTTMQGAWRYLNVRKSEGIAARGGLVHAAPPAGKEGRDLLERSQKVLGGVYKRIERRWSRAAVCIQRSVRIRLLGIPLEQARKVHFVQAPLTRGVFY